MAENRDIYLEYIEKIFSEVNIDISKDDEERFLRFYEMLIEKNKVMNLTAITEFHDVVIKHFIDSCMFKPEKGSTIIDIGTGAGFPGIPLKIMNPDCHMILLDSLQKRLNFLQEVAAEINLQNVEIIHSRAEDGARSDLRESCDIAVSRAVANLSTLLEYCLPYVKRGGYFAAYKSGKVDEEIKNAEKALQILGGSIETVKKFQLPVSNDERTIIIVRKTGIVPKKYPRKAGLPSKEPL